MRTNGDDPSKISVYLHTPAGIDYCRRQIERLINLDHLSSSKGGAVVDRLAEFNLDIDRVMLESWKRIANAARTIVASGDSRLLERAVAALEAVSGGQSAARGAPKPVKRIQSAEYATDWEKVAAKRKPSKRALSAICPSPHKTSSSCSPFQPVPKAT